MKPTTPVLHKDLQHLEHVYAKDQPQYNPLPTLVGTGRDGKVLSRWILTQEERDAIAVGADIYLTLLTFGDPLQPIILEVPVCDADLENIALRMGCGPEWDEAKLLEETRAKAQEKPPENTPHLTP